MRGISAYMPLRAQIFYCNEHGSNEHTQEDACASARKGARARLADCGQSSLGAACERAAGAVTRVAVRPLYLQNTSKHWFRNIENHKSHTSQPRSNIQYCIGHRKLFFRSRDYPSTTANQKKHPPPGPQKLQQQMGRTNTGAPCCLRSVKWHHQLRRRKVRLQVLEALVLGVVVLHLRERLRRLLQCRVDLSHAAHVG
jgi:hypothetical protein